MSRVLVEKNNEKKNKKKGKVSAKSKKEMNLLEMIPIRNCKWTRQKNDQQLIRILKPRFDTKFGKKIGKKLKIKNNYNINLDEYGTAVWRLCDGKLTVHEIGEHLRAQFGDDVEPLYPRLAAFLRILKSNDVIILRLRSKIKKN